MLFNFSILSIDDYSSLENTMNIRLLSVVGVTMIVTGCTSAPATVHYLPSSTMSIVGEVKIGNFKYSPGENNKKIKANQIRNTALGTILLENNIDDHFEVALFSESEFVGLEVKECDNEVSGDIIEFLIDDLGYSIDWTLEVNYVLKGSDGNDCYNKIHKIEKNSDKFTNSLGVLKEVMKLNIEEALKDEDFVGCVTHKI